MDQHIVSALELPELKNELVKYKSIIDAASSSNGQDGKNKKDNSKKR